MVHPSVPCLVVTPICPHSLSFRSIVVPAGVELTVGEGRGEGRGGRGGVRVEGREGGGWRELTVGGVVCGEVLESLVMNTISLLGACCY